MKKLILVIIIMLIAVTASASTRVRGYYRRDGTYVQPHYRSSPNHTTMDNWGTKGNVNPYTGKRGTMNPEYPGYRTWPGLNSGSTLLGH